MSNSVKKFSPEVRARAVRLALEHEGEHPSRGTGMVSIAGKIGCSAGHGTKGERWYDWLYCPMADLEAAEYADTLTGPWTRGLLVRRNLADGDLRYFTT